MPDWPKKIAVDNDWPGAEIFVETDIERSGFWYVEVDPHDLTRELYEGLKATAEWLGAAHDSDALTESAHEVLDLVESQAAEATSRYEREVGE